MPRLLTVTAAMLLLAWSVLSILAVGISGDYNQPMRQFPHQVPIRLIGDLLMLASGLALLYRSKIAIFLLVSSLVALFASLRLLGEITEIGVALVLIHVIALYCAQRAKSWPRTA